MPPVKQRPPLTPLQRRQIADLKRLAPWLSLRRIAGAFGVTLHAVRSVLASRDQRVRLKHPIRCKGCGRLVAIWPCPACHVDQLRATSPTAGTPIDRQCSFHRQRNR